MHKKHEMLHILLSEVSPFLIFLFSLCDLSTNRLIPNPLRLRAFFTQTLALVRLILLIVAVKERPVRIAFRREDVGGEIIFVQ